MSTAAAPCPKCGEMAPLARKLPLEKAFDHVNPFQVHYCAGCNRSFWAAKEVRALTVSAALAALTALFVLHLVVQLILLGFGLSYGSPEDVARLSRDLPPGLSCPKCGSRTVSRSVLQPVGRGFDWVNPLTPYRCLDCWQRIWRPKPWPRLVSSLATAGVVAATLGLVPLRFRRRRREILDSVQ